ncbi:MAG: sulfite exporter TauE/SafE family protein [Halomonas sp.]|uniref:Sulfite exporter TauE/SafE family protein n=1 Tax=Billgrantia tianxiuensis TaxID=2497861 RepID=A0A6I6SMR9_9GAMM|nr:MULTISPECIES: sulfite exporter TauE/SafE family protein [Halomonas]MCE8033447.1 sulfite exporter TauE/SafE family protein [Halomonas sp. MCCC 1A11057]MDX5434583.1 sulfite exporter TauE/SafE family protein [Halomonas sp.]QHC49160.1 sulfite exporter TauE/SafE family protein [Halomonas tianxiuensis]
MDPTGLGLPPLLAAFVFGLLGGAHCIGMCGGIMSALTFAVPPSMRSPARLSGLLLGYNLGRIASYTLAGAVVASLGTVVALSPAARVGLQVFAAVMLILMALYIASWWKGLLKVEALGRHLWRHLEPIGKRLMPVVRIPQAIGLGAVWGWLPCGLVYSMLAWSLATADPWRGAALMAAFGLGTLPALLVTGLAARQLGNLIRHPATRTVAALAIIAFALWQLITLLPQHQHFV